MLGDGDAGKGLEDVPESAKNRVRSHHGFKSAQPNSLRCVRCQAPGRAEQRTRREANLSSPGSLCCDGGRTDTGGPRKDIW